MLVDELLFQEQYIGVDALSYKNKAALRSPLRKAGWHLNR